MVKVSVNRFVSRRIETIRNDVNTETQKLRKKALSRLKEIFDVAAKVARGEISHQRINGKMTPIKLKQRRKWVRVAEHTANMVKGINSNIDEKEIQTQLDELEKLIKEAQTIG